MVWTGKASLEKVRDYRKTYVHLARRKKQERGREVFGSGKLQSSCSHKINEERPFWKEIP